MPAINDRRCCVEMLLSNMGRVVLPSPLDRDVPCRVWARSEVRDRLILENRLFVLLWY